MPAGGPLSAITVKILLSVFLVFLMIAFHSSKSFSDEEEPERLAPCPGPPNCVCSTDPNAKRRVNPFALLSNRAETLSRLEKIISSFPRARVVFRGNRYLKAEFKTRLGFIDIVEFLVDENMRVAQVRSASTTGWWDLGMNRKRIESLRRRYVDTAVP